MTSQGIHTSCLNPYGGSREFVLRAPGGSELALEIRVEEVLDSHVVGHGFGSLVPKKLTKDIIPHINVRFQIIDT